MRQRKPQTHRFILPDSHGQPWQVHDAQGMAGAGRALRPFICLEMSGNALQDLRRQIEEASACMEIGWLSLGVLAWRSVHKVHLYNPYKR